MTQELVHTWTTRHKDAVGPVPLTPGSYLIQAHRRVANLDIPEILIAEAYDEASDTWLEIDQRDGHFEIDFDAAIVKFSGIKGHAAEVNLFRDDAVKPVEFVEPHPCRRSS